MEPELPTTSLAQPRHTVNLDESPLQKILVGGVLLGIFALAVQGIRRPARTAAPDAAEELALEARRIQRRVAQRRRQAT